MKQRISNRRFLDERGIALVVVLVLSAVALAVMVGLLYMIASRTQVSGLHKRYKTALESGLGGADIMYQFISLRGEDSAQTELVQSLTNYGIAPVKATFVTTDAGCKTDAKNDCLDFAGYTGLATKFNVPTACWSNCNNAQTIDPTVNSSFDMAFQLPGTSGTYNVYAKVVDTVVGNSGAGENLVARGVTDPRSGERQRIPYLYTIEMDAESANAPDEKRERAKLSILYEY